MKKIYLIVSFLLIYIPGNAQLPDWLPGSPAQLQYIIVKDPIEDYIGDPFFEEQFIPGKVIVEESEKLDVYLRYNAYKDQVYIKVYPNAKDVYVLPKTSQISYQLRNYSYKLKSEIGMEGKLLEGYFIEFYKGNNVSLFAKLTARIVKSRRESTVFIDRSSPKMEVFMNYYLRMGDSPLKEVRLREKDFKKLFNESPEMEKYFKENKVKDLESIVKMLVYYENNVAI